MGQCTKEGRRQGFHSPRGSLFDISKEAAVKKVFEGVLALKINITILDGQKYHHRKIN